MAAEEKKMAAEEENDNRKKRNSNPGVRMVNGKIYDSVNGKTCHWCRQKRLEDHVQCSLCPIKFCGACLMNRNGEDISLEMQPGNLWVCPKCRKGCGPGCNQCCNCGPCRKVQGLKTTGIVVHLARGAGFSNVHDFLVFQNTAESPIEIASRKKGRGWCKSVDHFLSRPEEFVTKYLSSPKSSTSFKQSMTTPELCNASKSGIKASITSPFASSIEDSLPHGCNAMGQNKSLKPIDICTPQVKIEDTCFSNPFSEGHENAQKRNFSSVLRIVNHLTYESTNGKTCHWCRQKTRGGQVHCSRCTIHFCGPCLQNRHGEDIVLEMQEGNAWVCPRCRKGCGPGCMNCCNCGPCRRGQGLEHTGMMVHLARSAGFTNVHDYLIFETTGESPREILRRKIGRGWCKSAEYFWSRPDESHLLPQSQPRQSTGHQQTSTCERMRGSLSADQVKLLQRMRGSLSADQVKQLPKSYLPKSQVTKEKFINELHDCRASWHENNIGSCISEFAVNSSSHNNPPLSGSVHSRSSNAAAATPAAIVPTSISTLNSHNNPPLSGSVHSRSSNAAAATPAAIVPTSISTQNSAATPATIVPTSICTQNSAATPATIDPTSICTQNSAATPATVVPTSICTQNSAVTPATIVPTSICTQNSGVASKPAFQYQSPIACLSETTNLSNQLKGCLSYSQPMVNINSSTSGFESKVKVEAQTLHSAFSRNVNDSIWANHEIFELPLAFQAQAENLQMEIVEIDSDSDDKDYKTFMNNVKLDGLSFFLDLKVKQEESTTLIKYEDINSDYIDINAVGDDEKQKYILDVNKKCKLEASMTSEIEQTKRIRVPSTEEINNAHIDMQSLEFTVDKRDCYPPDCIQQIVKTEVPSPEVSSPSDVTTVGNIECSEVPVFVQFDNFKEKLEATLQKPYSTQELNELSTVINHRKPIERFRHTRQRTIRVETEEDGFSYLDYHPDLAVRLASATCPEEKLTLLRGFFFWLKHASWPKAYQPWVLPRKHRTDDDDSDCMEVDEPDSEVQGKQVMAVVLPEDER